MAVDATITRDAVPADPPIEEPDYETLATFRHHLRQFFAFSDTTLKGAGVMPAQYQAMLAIRAAAGRGTRLTASSLAKELFIRLNTAVELIDRLEESGYVRRCRSRHDRRHVELELTPRGTETLVPLAAAHLGHHRATIHHLLDAMRKLAD